MADSKYFEVKMFVTVAVAFLVAGLLLQLFSGVIGTASDKITAKLAPKS